VPGLPEAGELKVADKAWQVQTGSGDISQCKCRIMLISDILRRLQDEVKGHDLVAQEIVSLCLSRPEQESQGSRTKHSKYKQALESFYNVGKDE
jgi:ribosomal protein S28E/S33